MYEGTDVGATTVVEVHAHLFLGVVGYILESILRVLQSWFLEIDISLHACQTAIGIVHALVWHERVDAVITIVDVRLGTLAQHIGSKGEVEPVGGFQDSLVTELEGIVVLLYHTVVVALVVQYDAGIKRLAIGTDGEIVLVGNLVALVGILPFLAVVVLTEQVQLLL